MLRDKYCPICEELLRLDDVVYATPGHSVYGCEFCMDADAAEEEGLNPVKARDAWL